MTILGGQLDYVWNELESRNGEHSWSGGWIAHAFDLGPRAGRHTFSLEAFVRTIEEGRVCSSCLLALASIAHPLLALEFTSSGLQLTRKTSWDTSLWDGETTRLLDFPFISQLAIVELVELQPVNHSNKFQYTYSWLMCQLYADDRCP